MISDRVPHVSGSAPLPLPPAVDMQPVDLLLLLKHQGLQGQDPRLGGSQQLLDLVVVDLEDHSGDDDEEVDDNSDEGIDNNDIDGDEDDDGDDTAWFFTSLFFLISVTSCCLWLFSRMSCLWSRSRT